MRLPITVSPDCNLSAGPSKNDKGPFVFVDGEPMMIELQGSLETEGGVPLQDGQSIGTLDVSNASKPTLRVSHHLLTGKVVNLPTPLAVLRHDFLPSAQATTTTTARSDASDSEDDDLPAAKRVKLNQRSAPPLMTSSPDTFGKLAAREQQQQEQDPSRRAAPKTPLAKLQKRARQDGEVLQSSSPLPPSPATPLSVTELKQGKHEIIGLIRRKIVFSQRPMPIVS